MPKDCPKCRLVNPNEAQRCDCGWDFVTRTQQRSYVQPKRVATGAGLGIVGVFAVLFLFRAITKLLLTVLASG